MNKNIYHIILVGLLLASCGTNKGIVKNEAPVSKADYPYMEAFHKGLRYKTNGRVEEAVFELEKCLAIRQDDDAVYYALSKLELLRGNEDKSAEYIVKAADIDPDNTWYTQELAYMYFEKENYPKAVENFARLVELEPRNVDWLYGYSEALVRNGQTKDAIDVLNKTEEQTGKHPQYALQRYYLYMTLNDVQKAEEELMTARKNFPKDASVIANLVDHYYKLGKEEKAVVMLKELVKADPDNGRAHLALADVYQRSGDLDKAYDELKLAFAATDVDIDTKMRILIKLQESSSKIDQNMLELLDVFMRTYPEDAKAYSIQGDYRISMEDEEGALESYRRALSLDKSLYPIWNQVMIMEYQRGLYEDLFAHSSECMELFPSMSTVYLLNGVSANQLKKYDEALEVLNFGRELVVNDRMLEAEFYGQIGEAQFGLKENQEGIDNYKKAIELDPESNLLKNNLARRLASLKQELDLAESLVKQIVKSSPGNGLYHDTYGWVMFQKGAYDKATEWFMKASELTENDKLILEHIGDGLFMMGKKDEALEYWIQAKELGSGNEILEKKIADKKYYDPVY